jgi:putative membrane protein insertion efficiency factor
VLPRNKIFLMMFFLLFFFAIQTARAENIFIKFYQEHISVVDGDRCQMYPSCSSYALKTIEKHGPFLGWAMACDRLVRCGRDETRLSMQMVLNNNQLTYDPVDANDFWWFEKEKK